MGAIQLKAYMGSYIQNPLDMNTSLNVCQVLRLILDRMDEDQAALDILSTITAVPPTTKLGHVYFYTISTPGQRLLQGPRYNLVAYRSTHKFNMPSISRIVCPGDSLGSHCCVSMDGLGFQQK